MFLHVWSIVELVIILAQAAFRVKYLSNDSITLLSFLWLHDCIEFCPSIHHYFPFLGAPAAASDKENPDFVPSIFNFPANHPTTGDGSQKVERYIQSLEIQEVTASSTWKYRKVRAVLVGVIDILSDNEDNTDAMDVAPPGDMDEDPPEEATNSLFRVDAYTQTESQTKCGKCYHQLEHIWGKVLAVDIDLYQKVICIWSFDIYSSYNKYKAMSKHQDLQ